MPDKFAAPNNPVPFRAGPIASFLGVVKSVPFSAKFERIEVLADPRGVTSEQKAVGAIYRDSEGRVRHEFRVEVKNQESLQQVTISDLSSRTVVALDVAAKVAIKFTQMGPPAGENVEWGWGFSGPWSVHSAHEERIIEGVPCKKAHSIVPEIPSAAEYSESGQLWVSEELKYSILERVGDSQHGLQSWRLYDIQRIEPPSSLFLVPVGYTVVERSKLNMGPSKR